jgi:drug/metabolite transporter (DMT)-like permease
LDSQGSSSNSDCVGHKSHALLGYLFAFISAALFGSISTVAKPALSTIHPLLLSSMVYLVAALAMTPMAHKRSNDNSGSDGNTALFLKRKNYSYIFVIAISGAVIAPTLYFIGLERTMASHAAILSTAEIVFTVVIAVLFFEEQIKLSGYIGVILVLFAVIIITTVQNLQALGSITKINYGDLLVVASTLFWGIDNNISKIISHRINAAKIVQLKSLIGGLLLMAIVIILGIKININLAQIPSIILLGAGGFAISIFLFLHSLRRIGTVRTIVIFSTSSIFGVIFSIVFLHEQLQILQITAVPIMIFGIYLVNRKNSNVVI